MHSMAYAKRAWWRQRRASVGVFLYASAARVPTHLVIESISLLDIWADVCAIYLKQMQGRSAPGKRKADATPWPKAGLRGCRSFAPPLIVSPKR